MHTTDKKHCRFDQIVSSLQMHPLMAQHYLSALPGKLRRQINGRMQDPHDKRKVSTLNLTNSFFYFMNAIFRLTQTVIHPQIGKQMITGKPNKPDQPQVR